MAAVNPPQSVGMITRSTMEIDEIGVFHPRPHAIMMDPGGDYLYSGSLGENRILTVEIETGDGTVHTVDGPTHTLVQFGITPDRNTLIVGGRVALAMAVLTSRWLNRVRLSRYLFYPPLVFLSLIVIYMRLVSYTGLFGAFHV